jgi:MATE family multidrug resistance protein
MTKCSEYSDDEAVPMLEIGNDDYVSKHSSDDSTTTSSTKLNDATFNLLREGKELIAIAMPTIVVQFGTFFLYPQCASAIGRHLDSNALGAFSLGSLSGNMTCVSIIIGTLTASETLQPRAFGLRQYNEVGMLAIRGFFMCFISLLLPVTALVTRSDRILVTFGQDEDASALASQWIKVYILSIPSLLSFRVTQRFLACQNIVMPCVFGSAIGCFLLHPFILKWTLRNFGFIGSSWAIVITQSIQFLLCISFTAWTGSYEEKTWPGLTLPFIAEALSFDQLAKYAKLSVGGVLSLSEWWFWESICFIAGKFGLVDLCVHTISYQLIPIAFMIPLGISIGMIVRLGNLLPVDVNGAKRLAAYTMIFTVILAILVSAIIYQNQKWIVSLFTTDEIVIKGCEIIWTKLCIYNILLWIFCVSRSILNALGLQWRTAVTMFCVLWCATIPFIQYSCVNRKDGFYLMWNILPWSYAALNVGLTICYVTADWETIATKISVTDQSVTKGHSEGSCDDITASAEDGKRITPKQG